MKRLVAIVMCAGLWPADSAAGVTPQIVETPQATARSAGDTADHLLKQVASAVAASGVAQSARKAAALALKAGAESAALAKAVVDPKATVGDLSNAAEVAATVVKAVAAEATTAAKGAVLVSGRVSGDVAKLRAVRAAEAAAASAAEAEAAASAAADGAAKAKAADDLEKTKALVLAVIAEVDKVVLATTTAAAKAVEAAEQVVLPDLPATSPADEPIFSALRMNVTAGAIFFNGSYQIVKSTGEGGIVTGKVQSSQFSQAATYFALEAQPRLWAGGGRGRGREARDFDRSYLEPIVNVRLTTIPVSTGAMITVPTEDALKSDKAAQVQLGALWGINFGGFGVGESAFHWSVAPVGRFMFQSVTDANRAVRVWNLDDDLYHAYTGGLRLSLYQQSRASSAGVRNGWHSVAYVEVAKGKFQNFETVTATDPAAVACLQAPSACLAKGVPDAGLFTPTALVARWAIEARLALQHLYLGLDINNGNGRDDMRFIGGLSVSLDRFFRRQ